MRETYSLWELGQTPLSEKLHNETSVDRVTTYFQNRKRKECIFLLLKSSKIKSSSHFSLLQLSTALLLKQKKNKIPGFYIACTSEEPQAMESAWDKWTNLFCRFWEVHSQGEWGQPEEKKTRDQNLMSKSQVITKKVNEKEMQISCCWKIQNFWMSNFSQSEVSTVVFKHQEQGNQFAEISWPVDR